MAVVLVTHDLGVVAEVAHRVVVMYGGRVVETGPTRDIFERPRHPYTEGLLRSRPPADRRASRLPVLPGSVPSASDWPRACRFHPRCPYAWDLCAQEDPPRVAGHEASCWLETHPERRPARSAFQAEPVRPR